MVCMETLREEMRRGAWPSRVLILVSAEQGIWHGINQHYRNADASWPTTRQTRGSSTRRNVRLPPSYLSQPLTIPYLVRTWKVGYYYANYIIRHTNDWQDGSNISPTNISYAASSLRTMPSEELLPLDLEFQLLVFSLFWLLCLLLLRLYYPL